jgi:hypothetical protein
MKVTLDYTELTAIKHNSNLQAFETFVKSAERKGIRPNAPWEAVLQLFVEWKNECELIAGKTSDSETYMQSIDDAIKEARAIIEN